MNRRESLKAIGLGSLTAGALLTSCKPTGPKVINKTAVAGRQDFEVTRDEALQNDTFFDPHETATIVVLADIIIPKDEQSGSATDAKVGEFIEFICKDEPIHQLPMRGGLKWLDVQCLKRYNNEFVHCTAQQQLALIDEIAYPSKAKSTTQQGIAFFNKMRELTSIGFYTSKIGIADLGYKGNAPGKWEGVPESILIRYGLKDV